MRESRKLALLAFGLIVGCQPEAVEPANLRLDVDGVSSIVSWHGNRDSNVIEVLRRGELSAYGSMGEAELVEGRPGADVVLQNPNLESVIVRNDDNYLFVEKSGAVVWFEPGSATIRFESATISGSRQFPCVGQNGRWFCLSMYHNPIPGDDVPTDEIDNEFSLMEVTAFAGASDVTSHCALWGDSGVVKCFMFEHDLDYSTSPAHLTAISSCSISVPGITRIGDGIEGWTEDGTYDYPREPWVYMEKFATSDVNFANSQTMYLVDDAGRLYVSGLVPKKWKTSLTNYNFLGDGYVPLCNPVQVPLDQPVEYAIPTGLYLCLKYVGQNGLDCRAYFDNWADVSLDEFGSKETDVVAYFGNLCERDVTGYLDCRALGGGYNSGGAIEEHLKGFCSEEGQNCTDLVQAGGSFIYYRDDGQTRSLIPPDDVWWQ